MKKLIAIFLATTLLMGMAGCAGASNTASPAPDSNAPQQSASASTPAAATESNAPTDGAPIKIGVVTSLTGEKALVGTYCKNAIDMAVDEVNESGGVLGRPVEVIYEDDMGKDTGAVNAYNKLSQNSEIAAIVGPYYSTMAFAISGDVIKAEIPTMVGGSNESIGKLDNPWLFQARSHDGIAATAIANFAVDGLGKSKISIIYDSDASGVGQQESAVKALTAKGLTPVTNDAYNTGDKDFTAQIVKMQQAGAEVLLAYGLQVEAGLIMKQMRDMGVDIPIIGSTSYASQIAMDLAKEAAEGVYSVADYVPTSPRPEAQVFSKKYKELYAVESDFTASVDYDMFNLIVKAIDIAGSTDRTAIRDAVYKIQDHPATSTVFSFDENGVGGTGVLLTQIQNGAPVVLDTISAR